jgi:hypothetical protein
MYVTEYGVADLRGRSDEDCILAMLSICDARFQDDLCNRAKAAGKLRADFVIPPAWRRNEPARLEEALRPLRARGLFPLFPFGSDFDEQELLLLPALKKLQQVTASKAKLAAFLLVALLGKALGGAQAPLERLGLGQPRGINEWLLQKLVLRALRETATS